MDCSCISLDPIGAAVIVLAICWVMVTMIKATK